MVYLVALSASLIFFILVFFLSLLRNDYSTVDVFWGLAQVFIGAALLIFFPPVSYVQIILYVMISMWGIRLSIYLYQRNWHKGEDFRYVAMRKDWKGPFEKVHAFFKVFILQGFFAWLMSFTLAESLVIKAPVNLYILIPGMIIFGIGFFFEAVGDYQMRQFKKDKTNQGKLMTKGLWGLTRHPNYFGEVTLWWGVFITALSLDISILNALILSISPITITYLLLFLSGIPMLEKKYKEREDFKAYASKTPAFFPKLFKK